MVALTLVGLLLPSTAAATHRALSVLSQGPAGGNGVASATFTGRSDNGQRVFFVTSESLVASDTDVRQDVYERFGSTTTLVSTGSTGGNGGFEAFFDTSSSDGSRVIFTTNEQLTSADTDSQFDVYSRSGGVTTLLSLGSPGGNGAFASFFEGASADAARVFFATNEQMLGSDTDARQDVYERFNGTTSLVSAGAQGGNGDFDTFFEGASSDGTQVFLRTFEKLASTDTDAQPDIYRRAAGVTTQVSVGEAGFGNFAQTTAFAGASSDGSRVFFTTREKLVSTDTDTGCLELGSTVPCVDVYQRQGATTSLVSAGANGAFEATYEGASRDGTRVFFTTAEPIGSDADSSTDLYERSSGFTTLHSTGPTGGSGPHGASFDGASADGTHVFFTTSESLVAADSDGRIDVYERFAATTSLVSTGPAGGNSTLFDAGFDGVSDDGNRVFFHTDESLIGSDVDGRRDVYERFAGGTTQLSTGPLSGAGLDNFFVGASADATRAFFRTAEQFLGQDTDSSQDIYGSSVVGHEHPGASSPITVSLVPSFRQTISTTQCLARSGTQSSHGAPLALESCDPPAFTPGTVAHFGPQASGSAQLTVIPGNLGTVADESDLAVTVNLTDVRAGSAGGTDYDPSAGSDVTLVTKMRISDLLNGATLAESGTVADMELQVPVNCTVTGGPDGSTCATNTTADAVTPGMVKEGQAMVVASFRLRLNDSGNNGTRGDGDDRNFAMQGFYVP